MEQGVQKLNAAVEAWSIKMAGDMNAQISSMGLVDTGNLFRKLRARLRLFLGEADRVSFKMPRYGIMLDKGAGRGSNLGGGSNRAAFSSIARKPKPWLSNVLNDAAVAELANILAKNKGDMEASRIADEAVKQIESRIKLRN